VRRVNRRELRREAERFGRFLGVETVFRVD
jgi:hypothetical protein